MTPPVSPPKLAILMDVKNHKYGRVSDYAKLVSGVEFLAGKSPWSIKVDVALPCATQNELTEADAKTLIANGVLCVAEGANMPSTNEAARAFEAAGVLYAPGKASNAGGVATSGLEMSQNSARLSWPPKKWTPVCCKSCKHPRCLREARQARRRHYQLHRRRQHRRLCEGGRRHAGARRDLSAKRSALKKGPSGPFFMPSAWQ
jgi:hypothetical protein